jgi:aldose 1-epimerase
MHTSLTIKDTLAGTQARIAPTLGFNCFSFQAANSTEQWEVLWSDPLFLEGTQRPSRTGIPLLFPFPGRIQGAKFEYEGQQYELDTNDGKGNGIHGFVYTRAWRVIEQTENSVTGEFQASVDDPTILQRWPCDFRIRATYTITGNTLTGTYEIHNPDMKTLPWGFGTHPYFRVPIGQGNVAECLVTIPVTKKWELQDSLPTGKLLPEPLAARLQAGVPFPELQLDDVYSGLIYDQNWFTGKVADNASHHSTTIRFSNLFRECVGFTPPHREAICIEPYTGLTNAFEMQRQGVSTNLQYLSPGESLTTEVIIEAE